MDTAVTGSFALAWNAFVAFWTIGAFASGGLLFALFSAPFWFAGVQLARTALGGALLRERLALGGRRWRLGQQLAVLNAGSGEAGFEEGKGGKVRWVGGFGDAFLPWHLNLKRLPYCAQAKVLQSGTLWAARCCARAALGCMCWDARDVAVEQAANGTGQDRGTPPTHPARVACPSAPSLQTVEGSVEDLSGARVVTTAIVNDEPQTCVELLEGVNRCGPPCVLYVRLSLCSQAGAPPATPPVVFSVHMLSPPV